MAIAAGGKLRPSDLGTGGSKPQGILRRGNRPTASSTTTTEVGVLRIDGIPIVAGRAYPIDTGPLYLYSPVTSDVVAGRIRTSTSGAATTSSTVLGQPLSNVANSTSTSFPESRALSQVYVATVTGTLSVLLTVGRTQGTGSVSIQVGCDMWIADGGIDPGDTGVDV